VAHLLLHFFLSQWQKTKNSHTYEKQKRDNAKKKKAKREAWYRVCAFPSRFPGPFELVVTAQDAKTRATVWSSRRPVAFCRKTPALALGTEASNN
jgi:hypothetical protein